MNILGVAQCIFRGSISLARNQLFSYVPRMFGNRVTPLLLLLTLFMANNLHLPFLQVIAWSGMLVSYSQNNSFNEAVEMTFDGENPCPMCKAIEKIQVTSADQTLPDGIQGGTTRDIFGLSVFALAFLPPAYSHQRHEAGYGLAPQVLTFPPPNPPPISA